MEKKVNRLNQDISPLKILSPTLNANKNRNALSKDKFLKNLYITNKEQEKDKINFSTTMKKKKIILNGKDINTTPTNHSFLGKPNDLSIR